MFSTLSHSRGEDLFEEVCLSHRSDLPSELMLSASSSLQLSEFSSSDEDESEHCHMRALSGASALQLKELLGRGSCGSVYKTVWKGVPVAVKVSVTSYSSTGMTVMASSMTCMQPYPRQVF